MTELAKQDRAQAIMQTCITWRTAKTRLTCVRDNTPALDTTALPSNKAPLCCQTKHRLCCTMLFCFTHASLHGYSCTDNRLISGYPVWGQKTKWNELISGLVSMQCVFSRSAMQCLFRIEGDKTFLIVEWKSGFSYHVLIECGADSEFYFYSWRFNLASDSDFDFHFDFLDNVGVALIWPTRLTGC